MYIEAFIISILVGLFRKGKISNFKSIYFQKVRLLFIAVLIQLAINYIGMDNQAGILLHIGSYFMLFIFFWVNRDLFNYMLPLGAALNFLVIVFNGGSMPVFTGYMPDIAVNQLTLSVTHTVLDETTRMPWLADILYIRWPYQQMISIGDIFLVIGIFIFVQRIMVNGKITEYIYPGKYLFYVL